MKTTQKIVLTFLFVVSICINSQTRAEEGEGSKRFLVYGGKTGWIGQQIVKLIQDGHHEAICGESRLENREDIFNEIEHFNPDYIINTAGVTGRPNVDWCEDNKQTVVRTNLIGLLNLVDVAYLKNIPVTNFGTGCIFQYDEAHPIGSGIGFTEEDEPNFDGSYYSKTKGMLDKLLRDYPNVLNLRVRMPLSADLNPRNFITKITRYQKVVNIPNSMSVLDDLLPISIEMTLRGLKGNYNFTNPGVISHNEILKLYKQYIDPNFTWTNFTLEEQDEILKAKRSNNELDVSKLLTEFPDLPPIQVSIVSLFERMKVNLNIP